MGDYFNCKLCDKSIMIKSNKKHLFSQYHNILCMSIISRYSITNPHFLQIENILKNYVLDYNKKYAFFLFIRKWKLIFSDTFAKNKYYQKRGHKFSHISEMNITFITVLRNMTYEHYLIQPKPMVEWILNKKLAKNSELIKTLGNSSHPLIRKYQHIIEDDGEK